MNEKIFYFEDLKPGLRFVSDILEITRDDIVDFARKFDPQAFHTGDSQHIGPQISGDVIASGWHISSVCMKLLVDTLLIRSSCVCSPGVDLLKWPSPMIAGDVMKAEITIIETKITVSKPDWGLVKVHVEMTNQDEKILCIMEPVIFFGRRP
ncbi:hotdog family protein [Desulforegula conservatrix]|uniref:hypothetical protein n=1 Tax=Desulforegula conservatrix TaxID=153026 RepID=UPI00041D1C13|nr:hypothetical protein [Desulforegula conservatrix]